MIKKKIDAIVFGSYETGLGVIRSLYLEKLKVLCIDFRKEIALYSRCKVGLEICPHPLEQEGAFINWIHKYFSNFEQRIPVFITSDDFLTAISKNRDKIGKYFLFNLISDSLLKKISNKDQQMILAQGVGVKVPETLKISNLSKRTKLPKNMNYPVFIKGLDVNTWRKKIIQTKGFKVSNEEEMGKKLTELAELKIPSVVIQEIIEGPDTNHYKYCCYINPQGKILAEFILQKIRQNPINFGIGAVVESCDRQDVKEVGRRLFKGISYVGIGSAEFKIDKRDGELKLIEINPRYWQQNYLPTFCGMNFAYLNYRDIMGREPNPITVYTSAIKWVNWFLDLNSFLEYRKIGVINFWDWRKSLSGRKIYSDFMWYDPLPFGYYMNFGLKLLKIIPFIIKRIKKLRLQNEKKSELFRYMKKI
jgi:predicted ATP-grasp superfamily ATP-dependent carboligase